MERRPRVSALTATWQRARYLPGCVASVRAQDFPDLEHVVVDDGSTDDTSAVLGALGGGIRVHRQENAGAAAARNRCVEMARGDFVAFLDSDDEWLPGKLRRQVPMLEADPEAGMLYSQVEYFDVDGAPVSVRPSGRSPASGHLLPGFLAGNLMEVSSVIVRRDILLAAGPFDPEAVPLEDYDMWIRVASRTKVLFEPIRSARIRLHPGQLRGDPERNREVLVRVLHRNLELLVREHPEMAAEGRRIVGLLHLRRARRRLRDGRREDAEREVAEAVRLHRGLRFEALAMRVGSMLKSLTRGKRGATR